MRILYISTISNTINAFLIPHIEMLIRKGYKVDVACNVNRPLDKELDKLGVRVYQIDFNRNPISKDNIYACQQLKKILKNNYYDIVHTHTPIASAISRYITRKHKIKKIYTAHGFHFYKGASLKNWLFYYPIERILARWTDVLITINEEDYKRAKNFNAKEIRLINGVGIDLNKFNSKKEISYSLHDELDIVSDDMILLSVGELNNNKNHQVIIKALAKLQNEKIHYVIAGEGYNKKYLSELSNKLGISDQVHLLGFRNDTPELYSQVDVFVFPSYREGLSASLMEAMASGLPVICSNIRGNKDLINQGKGGYLVSNQGIEEYHKRINKLYKNSTLRVSFGKYNQEKIKKFSVESVLKTISNIYSEN